MKREPESLLLLINNYVRVQLIKDYMYEGFVQSIDPISFSLILSVPQGNTYQTLLIPGHAVVSIVQTSPNDGIIPPERKQDMSQKDVSHLKNQIMAWFKKNLLPVSECDDKIILGNVSVLPPYRTLDICTDNTVVALQIRRIMENMPDNFMPGTE